MIPAFAQNGRSVKRGIAYGHHSEADLAAVAGGVSWWYNWYHQPEASVIQVYRKYELDFVPMTWNNSFNEAGLRAFYASHPEARYLLAFNEPNFTTQANMKPSQVAAAWPRLEAIAADYGLEIVGPAVNWCGTCVSEGGTTFTNPYDYLDAFFALCPKCRVDYLAVHNYMCYTSALSGYIEGFRKYGKKIWLTEYACWDQNNITLAMQKNLMKSSIDYMENDTLVYRYSWFTGDRSGAYPYLDLFAPQSGKLTELGQFYVTYKARITDPDYFTPVPERIEAEHYSAMSGISTETTSDFDGTENVGWVDAGDWMEYNIEVPGSGTYFLYFRMAATAGGSLILRVDGQNTDTLKFSATGGWQSWKTLELETLLPAGKHKLAIYAPTGGFNLNWLRISDHADKPPSLDAGPNQVVTLPANSTLLTGFANDENKDALRFSWRKYFGPASFHISDPASDTTGVSGLVQGKYIFELSVSDGTYTLSDRVTVDVVLGTELEVTNLNTARVYPNPAGNLLYYSTARHNETEKLTLTDVAGKCLVQHTTSRSEMPVVMDLSAFPPGFYLLKVTGKAGTDTYPVVKK